MLDLSKECWAHFISEIQVKASSKILLTTPLVITKIFFMESSKSFNAATELQIADYGKRLLILTNASVLELSIVGLHRNELHLHNGQIVCVLTEDYVVLG